MLDTIIALILFVISFAALICIHEAGHLSMAKLFKVYCKEYSIGFGPAIYSKRRQGKETKFSIRCIPLGGYVAMFGEEGQEEDPEFKGVPLDRSLDGIKKWKKAIVVAAGVILNAILAFILVFISNFAFKQTYFSTQVSTTNTQLLAAGVTNESHVDFFVPEYKKENGGYVPFSYEYTDSSKLIHAGTFYIVDPNVIIDEEHFVLTYYFDTDKHAPIFTDGLSLYKGIQSEKIREYEQTNKVFSSWVEEGTAPDYVPYIEDGTFKFEKDVTFEGRISFRELTDPYVHQFSIKHSTEGKKVVNKFENNLGLSLSLIKEKLSKDNAGERLKNTFVDYGNASIAVFKGIKILFTGGIKNMSGVVGIFDTSAQLYSNYTFATYLYFWGLISVNLAIFNLLPFPGLDGWQLLVTAIEGISKKKLPTKFKTIMSLIGLGLLFALMIAIVIIDIGRLIGF